MKADRPSRTAQYAATVRAILHDRGVIDDPYAAPMLTPLMRATRFMLRRGSYANSPFFTGLAARTVWFDHAVRDAIADAVTQVVTIGAGYDSRAWRLAANCVQFFEADHPATQADKRQRAPHDGPTYVPVNLLDDALPAALAEGGVDLTQPTLFVIEGVTMYLDVADLRTVFTALADAAGPASRLAVNFAAPRASGSRQDRRLRGVLSLGGRLHKEPFREGREISSPDALVEQCGWPKVEVWNLRDVARTHFGATALRVDEMNDAAVVVLARQ